MGASVAWLVIKYHMMVLDPGKNLGSFMDSSFEIGFQEARNLRWQRWRATATEESSQLGVETEACLRGDQCLQKGGKG